MNGNGISLAEEIERIRLKPEASNTGFSFYFQTYTIPHDTDHESREPPRSSDVTRAVSVLRFSPFRRLPTLSVSAAALV